LGGVGGILFAYDMHLKPPVSQDNNQWRRRGLLSFDRNGTTVHPPRREEKRTRKKKERVAKERVARESSYASTLMLVNTAVSRHPRVRSCARATWRQVDVPPVDRLSGSLALRCCGEHEQCVDYLTCAGPATALLRVPLRLSAGESYIVMTVVLTPSRASPRSTLVL